MTAATVATPYLSSFIEAVEARSADVEAFLAEFGFSQALFADRDNSVPFSLLVEMVQRAIVLTGDEFLGLHAGEPAHPASWGMLAQCMMNCDVIGEAMQVAARYEHIVNEAISTETRVEDDYIYNKISFGGEFEVEELRPMVEQDFAAMVSFGKFLARRPTLAEEYLKQVCFQHQQPDDCSEYIRVFGLMPEFGCADNVIVLDSRIAEVPVVTGDKTLLNPLLIHLEGLSQGRAENNQAFTRNVIELLHHSLHSGEVGKEKLAGRLNISVSTLQRRLKEECTSYQQVLDQVRYDFACQELEKGETSLTELAFLLGYSSASAFNNAFKKWTGHTPRRYRALKAQVT